MKGYILNKYPGGILFKVQPNKVPGQNAESEKWRKVASRKYPKKYPALIWAL